MDGEGDHTEREFKFDVGLDFDLPDLGHLVGSTERLSDLTLRAVYFDTRGLRLWRRGVTLRHRSGEGPGDGFWTLKLPVADRGKTLDRTELAWAGTRYLVPADATRILRGLTREDPLDPVAELATARRRLVLHDRQERPLAELDDDIVTVIVGGERGHRFRQVELELASARPEAMDGILAALHRAGALPGGEQKLGTALRLAGRITDPPDPRILTKRSSIGDVVRAFIGNDLDRMLHYDYRLRLQPSDPSPQDIHQARVATRRLRSDLKLVGDRLEPKSLRHLLDELQWLAGKLGAVRDADVLACDHLPAGRETTELRKVSTDERRRAAQDLTEVMGGSRYLSLLDRLEVVSATPPFRRSRRRGGPDVAAVDVMPGLVRHRWATLRRAVRKAGQHPSDAQLHKIRIQAKQLRYSAELAGPILGKPARRMSDRAEAVQTVLGEHHDAVTAEQWLLRQAGMGSRMVAFSAGMLVAEERHRQRELERAWRHVWAELDHKRLVRSLH